MIQELLFRVFPRNLRFWLIGKLLKDDEKYLFAVAVDLKIDKLYNHKFYNCVKIDYQQQEDINRDLADLREIRKYLSTKEYK